MKYQMSLRTTAHGRVVLTYQSPNQKQPVSRSFYSSGGYVFEDLITGDHLMTPTLEVYDGTNTSLLATSKTLVSVLRKAYQTMKTI
jgi:hypothetical protein